MPEINWSTADDWDSAEEAKSVIHADVGVRNADEVALGFDPDVPPVSDAVAYWPMDDDSGPLEDVISGYDATLNDGTPGQPGPLGTKAVEFTNTTNSGAVAPVSSDPTGGGSFSIAAWISIPGEVENEYVIVSNQEDGSLGEYRLSITSDGEIHFDTETSDDPFLNETFHTDRNYRAGEDYFLIATYDDDYDSNVGRLRVYLNGDSGSSLIDNGRPSHDGDISFGSVYDNYPLNGLLGTVILWDRALSPSEATTVNDAFVEGTLLTGWKSLGRLSNATVSASNVITDPADTGSTVDDMPSHEATTGSSEDAGLVINPNQDLAGVRLTIASNPGPSGYTEAWIAERDSPNIQRDDADISSLDNGDSFDLKTTLSAGVDYIVMLGSRGLHTRSEIRGHNDVDTPYTSPDIDVIGGTDDGTSSAYSSSELYQFDAVQAIFGYGEGPTGASIEVRQDTNGDGQSEVSETVPLENGTNTYDLTAFTSGGEYQTNLILNTADHAVSPTISEVTLTEVIAHDAAGDLSASATVQGTPAVTSPVEGSLSGEGSVTHIPRPPPVAHQAFVETVADLDRAKDGVARTEVEAKGMTSLTREITTAIFAPDAEGEATDEVDTDGIIKYDY